MGSDLALIKGLPVLRHDHHRQFLAEPFIWDPEGSSLVHRRVLIDHPFDLRAVDVLTAAQDHVLLAIDDVEVALNVDHRNVTGA